MTRGKAAVRVGVIHPIESYWLHWGPESQTGLIREQMEERFHECDPLGCCLAAVTLIILMNLFCPDFVQKQETR